VLGVEYDLTKELATFLEAGVGYWRWRADKDVEAADVAFCGPPSCPSIREEARETMTIGALGVRAELARGFTAGLAVRY
jgi:hypothetical protein